MIYLGVNRPFYGGEIFNYHHRSAEFCDLYKRTVELLRDRLRVPDEFVILFANGSTTVAIETVCASIGPSLNSFRSEEERGEFNKRFHKTMDLYCDYNGWEFGDCFICCPFETSKSEFKEPELVSGMNLLDYASGIGYYEINWNADVIIGSSGKILGGLPTMGIIFIKKDLIAGTLLVRHKGTILDLCNIYEYSKKYQTPNTSLIPQIFSLQQSLLHFDIEKVRSIIDTNSSFFQFMPGRYGDCPAPILTFDYDKKLVEYLKTRNYSVYYNVYLGDKFQISTYNYTDPKVYETLAKEMLAWKRSSSR